MAPEMLLMSKKVWDTLTPHEQKIFRDAAKESVPYMRKLWDEKEKESRAIVEKAGAQVIEVDKKSFQDAMKPVYDKFITDPKLKDMVTRSRRPADTLTQRTAPATAPCARLAAPQPAPSLSPPELSMYSRVSAPALAKSRS